MNFNNYEYPITYEEVITINPLFTIFYTTLANNSTVTNGNNHWFGEKGWRELSFVEPVSNPLIKGPHDAGVSFGCCEHASVCISGYAEYIMTAPTGTNSINWEFGMHNVENGYGYLLKQQFTTVFHDNFISCCAVQNVTTPREMVYKFDILKDSVTTNKKYDWIHVASGSIEVGGILYNKMQTTYNINPTTELNMTEQTIAIACYTD